MEETHAPIDNKALIPAVGNPKGAPVSIRHFDLVEPVGFHWINLLPINLGAETHKDSAICTSSSRFLVVESCPMVLAPRQPHNTIIRAHPYTSRKMVFGS